MKTLQQQQSLVAACQLLKMLRTWFFSRSTDVNKRWSLGPLGPILQSRAAGCRLQVWNRQNFCGRHKIWVAAKMEAPIPVHVSAEGTKFGHFWDQIWELGNKSLSHKFEKSGANKKRGTDGITINFKLYFWACLTLALAPEGGVSVGSNLGPKVQKFLNIWVPTWPEVSNFQMFAKMLRKIDKFLPPTELL